MKKRILRITVLIALVGLLAYSARDVFTNPFSPITAQAVGDLTVDWGVAPGNPIFVINNAAPGRVETRNVKITNSATISRPVGIRGIKKSESKNLSTALLLTISRNGTDLYGGTSSTGPRTLAQFFTESATEGISLYSASPNTNSTINVKVAFDMNAGNQYQNGSAVFDLQIGISIPIPTSCGTIQFSGSPIYGTAGNDRLKGTNGNDLIFGFEGNDTIDSSNGDDCIVGGAGNDNLDGSNGNDYIEGNEGADSIDGGNGNDILLAGSENDTIEGSNGDDRIFGDEGNDAIDGGNGNDYIEGGNGNDTMDGRNDNDTLLGGAGTDSANGRIGTDRCEAETKSSCDL